ELLAQRDAVIGELGELLGRRRGTVRVAASTIPGEYILPPLLAAFRQIEPDVLVDVRIKDSAGAVADVAAGKCDLGFCGKRDEAGAKMSYTELWHDELALVVAPKHAWVRRQAPLDAEALRGADFVERRGGSGTQHAALSLLRELTEGRPPNHDVVARLDSPTAIKEAVVAGVGAAVLSERSVKRELRDGTLVRIALGVDAPRRAFYLVSDPRRTLSAIAEVFLAFVRERAGSVDQAR
ncbi:MAG: hypothetical protein KC503_28690, partial [Myxococcales bacterium]|nr:hypothetical protein [Myxococcales bacterium]